jgi:hypothetical protein
MCPVNANLHEIDITRLSSALSESLNKMSKKTGSGVRFSSDEICTVSSPLSKLDSMAGWENIWYSGSELQEMRHESRALCRRLRAGNDGRNELSCSDKLSSLLSSEQNNDETISLRGLEQRYCVERQRRKYIASKFILKAASKLRQEQKQDKRNDASDILAKVAQRCNAWATKLAIEEASRDYSKAYANSSEKIQTIQTPECLLLNYSSESEVSLDDSVQIRCNVKSHKRPANDDDNHHAYKGRTVRSKFCYNTRQ